MPRILHLVKQFPAFENIGQEPIYEEMHFGL